MAAGQGHGDVDLVVVELLLVVILLGPGGGGPPAMKYSIVFVSFICKMTPGSGSGITRVYNGQLPEMLLPDVPLNIGAKILGHVTARPRALVDCLHTFSLKQKLTSYY